MIRDRIELTQAYVDSFKLKEPVAPKSTLVFIAREIVVNQPGSLLSDVVFGDYHLLLIADKFNARDGIWMQSDTVAPQNMVGAPGPDVTILCRELFGAAVISIGGKGGLGTPGKEGKAGEKNCQFNEG